MYEGCSKMPLNELTLAFLCDKFRRVSRWLNTRYIWSAEWRTIWQTLTLSYSPLNGGIDADCGWSVGPLWLYLGSVVSGISRLGFKQLQNKPNKIHCLIQQAYTVLAQFSWKMKHLLHMYVVAKKSCLTQKNSEL